MMIAPETVMRWRLSALPFQEQDSLRDLPVKLRLWQKNSIGIVAIPPKEKPRFKKRGFWNVRKA
ncbi:hypothetical protein RMR21_009130 [Agrobacterium sp. rho-8.1]|jgi:hypothetical protein|nr:hypothetical protein [Agrobacterium sp. rho-8.1]